MKIYICYPYTNEEVYEHVAQILKDRGLEPTKHDLLSSKAVIVVEGCENFKEISIATQNRIPCFKHLSELMEYAKK